MIMLAHLLKNEKKQLIAKVSLIFKEGLVIFQNVPFHNFMVMHKRNSESEDALFSEKGI